MSILKIKDSQGNWVGVPTVKGDTGNGISSAVLNNDYTLTLTFTDGTTYKTPSIRGEKGERGEPATDMDIHICSSSEYDSQTRIPTIQNPNDKTFYLVPTEDGTSPDLFTEWVYVNNAWEMFGSASVDLTDYVKNTDLDEVEEKVEQNTEDLLKAFPIETASGNIASFEDGANDIPLQSLVVDINPVQDLHGQDAPYPAGGGKNKITATEYGGNLYSEGAGRDLKNLVDVQDYTENGNVIVVNVETAWRGRLFATSVLPAGDYHVHFETAEAGTRATIYVTDADLVVERYITNQLGAGTTSTSVTLTDSQRIAVIFANYQVGTVTVTNLQVESGSAYTAWSPYENICHISGWTQVGVEQSGVNLFDGNSFVSGRYDNADFSISSASDTRSAKIYLKAGSYTLSANGTSSINRRILNGSMSSAIRNLPMSFTLSTDGWFGFSTTDLTSDFKLELGSTATPYSPYKGRSITIDLGQTVYGGKLDVLSGELVIDRIYKVFDGSENWQKYASREYCFNVVVGDNAFANDGVVRIMSNCYEGRNGYLPTIAQMEQFDSSIYSVDGSRIRVYDKRFTALDDFKASIQATPLQVVYELATPITIQLTPNQVNSLLGVNNIFADTGDSEVEYRADPDLYIQKKMPEVPVDDVQINDTSIVTDGVANIPLANSDKFGVVKINGNYGIQKNSSNLAVINRGNDSEIKIGTNSYKPIVPYSQHQSVFYGLAKASGDTTQSASSNTIGNYTDEAKFSIQNMLGITDKYSPKEWVAESETELVTNAHSVGNLFYIGETLYKVIADLNAGDAVNVGVNVEEVNVNDILDDYATKEDVQDNVNIVEKNASGAIASFDDGMDDMPLKELVVDINPVQDLHGQDAPYPAGGGANVLNPENLADGTYITLNSDESVTIQSADARVWSSVNAVPLKAGTYTVKIFGLTAGYSQVRTSEDNYASNVAFNYNESATVTLTSDGGIKFKIGINATSYPIKAYPIMVNGNTVPAKWSPYENICPISGWTEVDVEQSKVNVWDEEWEDGTIDKATGENKKSSGYVRSKNYISVVGGEAYNLHMPWAQMFYYDQNKEFIQTLGNGIAEDGNVHDKTLIIPTGCYYMRFRCTGSYGATYNHDISINYPSTDHDYHPYTGRSITIQLGQTVYGGKLYPLEGKAVINMAMVDLGTLSWVSEDSTVSGLARTDVGNIGMIYYSAPVCSKFRGVMPKGYVSIGESEICFSNSETYPLLRVKWSGLSGKTDVEIKTALTGIQLCYELAEPIEIQLSANQINSLYGVNNIFADTGNTSVEYFSQVDKDLIDYIETSLKPYAKEEKLNDYVSDVQVNGSSIVTDGVANVPMASANKLGAVSVNGSYYGVSINPQDGSLYLSGATDSAIKDGNAAYRVVFPSKQHQSVFYGLAKSAGADEKNSTLPVGQYTDNAKDSIQNMLGITPLIASHETDPFESNHMVGELFIINGKLYRAKTALTAGEYVNEGTNVEVVSVAGVLDSKVGDVQVNGTSVVTDGVANVPYATKTVAGVVNVDSTRGIGMFGDKTLYIIGSGVATIKAGTNSAYPIVPSNQHASVFYGLAKSAGDTTQSASSNAVGNYTEDAKSAISDMLNGAIQISGTDPTIIAKSGIRYVCGEVLSLNFTPSTNGICDVMFTSGSTPTVLTLPNTVKMPEWFSIEANTTYEINIADGIYGVVTSWTL